MKAFRFIPILILFGLSGCYIDFGLDAPHLVVSRTEEYETEEIIDQVWNRDRLVYEEVIHTAWIDISVRNTGDITACNVSAEVTLYQGRHVARSTVISLPDIRPGRSITINHDTGYEFLADYSDYEIVLYWD